MLPAREGTNPSNLRWNDIDQAGTGPVSEDGPFHMSRLDLPAFHFDFPIRSNSTLRDVNRIAIILGKTEANDDLVLSRALANCLHFDRINDQRVLHIFHTKVKIDQASPDDYLVPARRRVSVWLEETYHIQHG